MKRKMFLMTCGVLVGIMAMVSVVFCAYHHEGEHDSINFTATYPDKTGTKLDQCALCHTGGQYEKKPGKWVSLGSCQWCHYTYGYDGSGKILDTMNQYGLNYHGYGRNAAAVKAIESLDSDGDGYSNIDEIRANRYPGDAKDYPGLMTAPYRIYTKAQIMALGAHTQFLLMNTSRSGDFYAQYTGLPVEGLLQDAGILSSATSILVYAPDGWSQYHPMAEDPESELYHVKGTYPASVYYYHEQADVAVNPTDGWCDYSAPSCSGRKHLDAIANTAGLKMILAYKREGLPMDPGILNVDNKLDGEGPFRVVPPQKAPNAPDQLSTADNQDVIWPYNYDWDHNAGAATRTVTIIKAEPLPEGTTDIDLLEAGWAYVDQEKIVVYGALDGTDSNGNGVLNSEEGSDDTKDFDGDGIPDYKDVDTARVRQANGGGLILLHTSKGAFANVQTLNVDDPAVPQTGKPQMNFPYGTVKFDVVNLTAGDTANITIVYPGNISSTASYYKIDAVQGWHTIPIQSLEGDTLVISLTDGDTATDADRTANGVIQDPGAVAVSATTASSEGGGGGCFIDSTGPINSTGLLIMLGFGLVVVCCFAALSLRSRRAQKEADRNS